MPWPRRRLDYALDWRGDLVTLYYTRDLCLRLPWPVDEVKPLGYAGRWDGSGRLVSRSARARSAWDLVLTGIIDARAHPARHHSGACRHMDMSVS